MFSTEDSDVIEEEPSAKAVLAFPNNWIGRHIHPTTRLLQRWNGGLLKPGEFRPYMA